jgi:hypothetical protein
MLLALAETEEPVSGLVVEIESNSDMAATQSGGHLPFTRQTFTATVPIRFRQALNRRQPSLNGQPSPTPPTGASPEASTTVATAHVATPPTSSRPPPSHSTSSPAPLLRADITITANPLLLHALLLHHSTTLTVTPRYSHLAPHPSPFVLSPPPLDLLHTPYSLLPTLQSSPAASSSSLSALPHRPRHRVRKIKISRRISAVAVTCRRLAKHAHQLGKLQRLPALYLALHALVTSSGIPWPPALLTPDLLADHAVSRLSGACEPFSRFCTGHACL